MTITLILRSRIKAVVYYVRTYKKLYIGPPLLRPTDLLTADSPGAIKEIINWHVLLLYWVIQKTRKGERKKGLLPVPNETVGENRGDKERKKGRSFLLQ